MSILKAEDLKKVYTTRFGGQKVEALRKVNFEVEEGEFVAIMGESGSGKTTLLNILAALDRPTSGRVLLDGQDLSGIREQDAAQFRRQQLGFVFQEFNLLDTFTLEDNILLPLVLSRTAPELMQQKLDDVSAALGIAGLLKKYPYEVSGGQKQRAAVARAIITSPRLLLADEPTGALDSRSSDELLKLFAEINAKGQTILMVTHSVKAASHAGRVLFIRDGEVYHQIYKGKWGNGSSRVSNTSLNPGGSRNGTVTGNSDRNAGGIEPSIEPGIEPGGKTQNRGSREPGNGGSTGACSATANEAFYQKISDTLTMLTKDGGRA